MNILITGGAGYIGSHTILEVVENRDWNVFSIDNFVNSSSETYNRIEKITGSSINSTNIDLCDLNELEKFFKNNSIDGVIHFAALKSVPESVQKPLDYFNNNLLGLLNLIKCCDQFSVSNFIFSSSCSVYGNTEDLPVREDTQWSNAESPYALTKQMGEQIIDEYVNSNENVQFVSLRYFNPVGAHFSGKIGESPVQIPNNLIPLITQTAAGIREEIKVFGDDYSTRDGTCIRDYIHVSDIAHAHLLAMDRLAKKQVEKRHEIFNLGTGRGISVLEAIKAFEKVNRVKVNYSIGKKRKGDVSEIYADNTKSSQDLNWTPRFSIEDMMESAWKWQMELMKKE